MLEFNGSEVVLRNHVITDVDVIVAMTAARDQRLDLESFFDSIAKIGALSASVSSASISTEKLEASVIRVSDSVETAKNSFEQAALSLEKTVERQVSDFVAGDGKLMQGISSMMNSLRERVEELTAGDDSPFRTELLNLLGQSQEAMRLNTVSEGDRQKKEFASLLDIANPTSPLRQVSMTLTGQIEKLDDVWSQKWGDTFSAISKIQESITKENAIAPIVEDSSKGGMVYEDDVFVVFQDICSAMGDDCEQTGKKVGLIPRQKWGDAVSELKIGSEVHARIAMEAQNSKLTKVAWEKECERSKANRGAKGFIGLCKHLDDMPNANRILMLKDQSVVLAFDPEVDNPDLLRLTYQFVKMNTLSGAGVINELNIAEVNRCLEDAIRGLEKFNSISTKARSIYRIAAEIEDEANSLKKFTSGHLSSARSAMKIDSPDDFLIEIDDLLIEEADSVYQEAS